MDRKEQQDEKVERKGTAVFNQQKSSLHGKFMNVTFALYSSRSCFSKFGIIIIRLF